MPTPIETVKEFFPTADDATAQEILWECTGWPSFAPQGVTLEAHIREQLRELSEASGGDIERAFAINWERVTDQMANHGSDE